MPLKNNLCSKCLLAWEVILMNAGDKKKLCMSLYLRILVKYNFLCVKFLTVDMWQIMCQCQLNSGTMILPFIECEKASFKNILPVSLTRLS